MTPTLVDPPRPTLPACRKCHSNLEVKVTLRFEHVTFYRCGQCGKNWSHSAYEPPQPEEHDWT